jgi:hypothetical protein
MNAWLYRKLLLLYPRDLRLEFGAEMTLAFAEDIQNMGKLRAWWCALSELVTVALPGQVSNRSVLVPALAFVFVASTQSAELCLALHQVTRVEASLLFDAIRLVVLLPSFLSACVAFVVTRFYAGCSITALQLD